MFMVKNSDRLMTPVLIIIFNRPDKAKLVFEAVMNAEPAELYIFADAPRANNKDDIQLCEAARNVTENICWDCTVHRYYADHNLGCGLGPYTAISWMFEHEEEGIILEDDCVPNNDFFEFCQELLAKYKAEERIMSISGLNFEICSETRADYYFTHYNNTLGWATWKRVWDMFDYSLNDFDEKVCFSKVKEVVLYDAYARYWTRVFEQIVTGEETTAWDAQFMYLSLMHDGVHIYPQKNLVKCIGFDDDATHTKNIDKTHRLVYGTHEFYNISFPLCHPKEIKEDFKVDCILMEEIFGGSLNYGVMISPENLSRINNAENLILFGAGQKCKQLILELNNRKINRFIVASTNAGKDEYLLGNKVNCISDLTAFTNSLVIITVKDKRHIAEMEAKLLELGFTSYFSLF